MSNSSYAVRMINAGMFPNFSYDFWSSSRPVMTGILISAMTISGFSFSIISHASLPLDAVAIISMSFECSFESIVLSPICTSGSSSTISSLYIYRISFETIVTFYPLRSPWEVRISLSYILRAYWLFLFHTLHRRCT